MSTTVYVDANVVLRFFQGEPESQAELAQRLFEGARSGLWRIVIHPIVLSEIIYVATSSHGLGLSRDRAIDDIRTMIHWDGVEVPERQRLIDALHRFESTRLDWADCILLSYASDHTVCTFDKDMISLGALSPETLGQQEPHNGSS